MIQKIIRRTFTVPAPLNTAKTSPHRPGPLVGRVFAAAFVLLAGWGFWGDHSAALSRVIPAGQAYDLAPPDTVIGTTRVHVIEKRQTLLDIARQYGLGFNEIQDLYPRVDPWIPPVGKAITIPCQWIVPFIRRNGLVVNLAEMRLYFFDGPKGKVFTFPVSIGEPRFPTPQGLFFIAEKHKAPSWWVPPSLKKRYAMSVMPPGPDNPLGAFWMGLSESHYGIHGTDMPWSVGRLVTHGCIRMYPEDIDFLFHRAALGGRVEIVYAPVKIGLRAERVYVEAHKDIYGKIDRLSSHAFGLLRSSGLIQRVDLRKFEQTLKRCSGMPVDVSRFSGRFLQP